VVERIRLPEDQDTALSQKSKAKKSEVKFYIDKQTLEHHEYKVRILNRYDDLLNELYESYISEKLKTELYWIDTLVRLFGLTFDRKEDNKLFNRFRRCRKFHRKMAYKLDIEWTCTEAKTHSLF